MTGFVWYSPEINAVVIQWFFEDCEICFEWGQGQLYEQAKKFKYEVDPTQTTLWFPLGML